MPTHHPRHTVHGAHMTHPPSLATSPSTSTDKIRKKSAHWADPDTDLLLEVLLRHREKGRTADNGFEPEVWQEAAKSLESTNGTGGEKTPDACRSRWQRLQREFKFAREYLEERPGFSWDRHKHKLQASEESWAAAERNGHQTKKGRKIYIPWFHGLSQLCPSQPQQHTSIQHGMPIPEPAPIWAEEGDSSENVDSFGLADPNHQAFAMPHQKRVLEYDVSLLGSTPQGGDRKRIRTHREPQGTPTRTSSTHAGQPLYQQLVPQQNTSINHPAAAPPQTPPHHAHQLHYSTSQYTPTINDPSLPSPVYPPITVSNGDMGSSLLRTPQSTETRREMVVPRTDKPRSERTLAAAASMPSLTGSSHIRSKSGGNIINPSVSSTGGLALSGLTPKTTGMSFSPGGELQALTTPANPQPQSGAASGRNTPGPTGSPESDAGARRIEAVRRLQLEELPDDDIMLILPEFEQSNAVVETYLGLNRDILRIRWLTDKVMARRRQVERARRADEFESGM
ncbi:uncharacterized protein CcaverHIS019_0408660 [Cutaneotrichosporon cavernicola]|uniref:Myb-like domain-containing protein n=1 Tax=Cutaneotrichosporon cavernicola TaxID=279322 RepID=A0AA48L4X7_9TREE|nr:uncharacterized protein CcaverHIS019_0408660 [Cutaneotrichosporon cavernicola]BEI92046.1 hypothetical protein CcaverHIS019_0408660 [Cutaneotrichosporon cavernicola]